MMVLVAPARTIPDPGFAGDDGRVAPEVVAALAAYGAEPDLRHSETLAVLQHARLLVPVVAVLGEVEHDEAGLAREKTSDMATVLMQGRDGRTALLAFTGTAALERWDPAARPVPVPAARAAEAAVQDGAAALLLDVAGPVPFVVETADLRELAQGHVLAQVSDRYAWVRPGR
jgi:SseB protein N-terminal domain